MAPTPAAGLERRERRKAALLCLALTLLTWAAFQPSLRNGFVARDDNDYLVENPIVRAGLTSRGLRWALTSTHSANWHPLTWLSHMADVELFGLRPEGHHAVGLALHAANASLLFLLLRGLTGSFWGSGLAAALFAVHPLRVESVAWAAERKDLLAVFFALLALLAYLRSVRGPRRGWPWLTTLFLALSLASKQMMITLPPLLLLLDWWPLGRWRPRQGAPGRPWRSFPPAPLWREKAALGLLALGAAALTFRVHDAGGAVYLRIPLVRRCLTALGGYLWYLAKTVWPTDLAPFYRYPALDSKLVLTAAASLAILAGVTVVAAGPARRRPSLLVGWLWYLGTLVPVVGLVQIGPQAVADRYSYWPQAGLFLVGVAVLVAMARALSVRCRAGLALGALACTLLFAGMARHQVRHWRDVRALSERILQFSPDDDVGLNGLAIALSAEGKPDAAAATLERALATNPKNQNVRKNLATLLHHRGRTEDAILQLQALLRFEPRDAAAQLQAGTLIARQGRPAEAIPYLEAGARLNPGPETLELLGGVLLAAGRVAEGQARLEEALRAYPGLVVARLNLARALLAQGRNREARERYAPALAEDSGLNRSHLPPLLELGTSLIEHGSPEEGVLVFERAARLDPDAQDARNNLGVALAMTGRRWEAAEILRAVVSANGSYLDARLNLGRLLLELGEREEGLRHLQAAAAAAPGDERVREALAEQRGREAGPRNRATLQHDTAR